MKKKVFRERYYGENGKGDKNVCDVKKVRSKRRRDKNDKCSV